jgi:CHAT domain-containing protein
MLLDRHDVVVLPSAAVLAALRARRPARGAPPRIAILADPVYGTADPRDAAAVRVAAHPRRELPRLPFAADEAAAIAQLVPADRVRLATGFDARRELLTTGALRGYDLLHIAVHGLVHARRPDLSGLALAMVDGRGAPQDGFLRLHEIYQLDLDAELVTLSGCDTALGPEIRGEGMIGLARGFLSAGARRVVASLWQVHDRATAELMRRFYDGMLARGLAPPAALREAQRGLRDQTPYAAPYFWAAFVLEGDDRP